MIEVRNLFKKYTVKNGIEVKALDDVSLKIDKVGMVNPTQWSGKN